MNTIDDAMSALKDIGAGRTSDLPRCTAKG